LKNYGLNFINNEDLYNHTKDIVEKYRFQVNLVNIPLSYTFELNVSFMGSIRFLLNLDKLT
jgi:hypothetical protein